MAADSTERWIRFFSKAGIPPRAAATYAQTFADNRIQLDMLLDLNKEYLRDMGITLMGDVIAILRQARQMHEELTHEKLLSTSSHVLHKAPERPTLPPRRSPSPPPKPVKSSKITKPPVQAKSSPTNSFNSTSSSSASSASAPPPTKKLPPSSPVAERYVQKAPVQRPPSSAVVPSSHSSSVIEKPVHKRLGAQPVAESLKRKLGATMKADLEVIEPRAEDVLAPIKKARRVLPEHEGGYKIKMPSGSTPRSQEILAKQKEIITKKTTVFDRLGRSSSPPSAAVSSTTSDPVFAITGLDSNVVSKKKASSVFSRLGDKQVSSTSVASVRAGILKTSVTTIAKKPVAVERSPTMVADAVASTARSEVRVRLGTNTSQPQGITRINSVPSNSMSIKKPISSFKTEGILARHSDSNLGIKSRLGEGGRVSKPAQVTQLRKKVVFSTDATLPRKSNFAARGTAMYHHQ